MSSPLLPEPLPLIADAEQILEDNISMDSTDMLQTVTTYDFKILWSDEKPEGSRQASIWRPRPPQGYVSLGDCLIAGPEPPTAGVLAVAEDSDIIASPIGFVLVGSIRQGDSGTHAVWRPINPQGYVSCGDVVTNDTKNPPQLTTCACLRQDLAIEVSRKGICTDQLSWRMTRYSFKTRSGARIVRTVSCGVRIRMHLSISFRGGGYFISRS